VTGPSTLVRSVDRIERLCASTLDERALRIGIIDELRRAIGFDAHVWLLTDPVTTVGSNPVADVPALPQLPTLIRLKYSNAVNRWTALSATPAPVGLLSRTPVDPDNPWRAMLAEYAIVDVASTVFRDRHGCWGFLDLWRHSSGGPFSDDGVAVLVAVGAMITLALRRRQAATFARTRTRVVLPRDEGPAVLIIDDALRITGKTRAATEWLE